MMQELARLQHDFLQHLQHGSETILAAVKGTPKVDVTTRLNIYAHAYGARLQEALQENFPALHTLLGDQAFAGLAQHYIHTHPSRHFSLRYFGDQLAELLRTHPDYAQQPVLAEMASFEWTVWAAFDAADADGATLADLQCVAPERWEALVFTLHPSCQLIRLAWNVPALWQAVSVSTEATPLAPQNAAARDWLVWRQGLRTYFRVLAEDEAWALQQIQAGQGFSVLCEGVCAWVEPEQAAARLLGFLCQWLEDGVIAQVRVSVD